MTRDEIVGWHHDSVDMILRKLQEIVKGRKAWRVAVHGVAESGMTERLNSKNPPFMPHKKQTHVFCRHKCKK